MKLIRTLLAGEGEGVCSGAGEGGTDCSGEIDGEGDSPGVGDQRFKHNIASSRSEKCYPAIRSRAEILHRDYL